MNDKNYGEAAKWCKLAAAGGNGAGLFWLGYFYEHGTGVAQDSKQAIKDYQLAGSRGAQHALVEMYRAGQGTKEDRQRTFISLFYSARRGTRTPRVTYKSSVHPWATRNGRMRKNRYSDKVSAQNK
jgi:TPR repeat protein